MRYYLHWVDGTTSRCTSGRLVADRTNGTLALEQAFGEAALARTPEKKQAALQTELDRLLDVVVEAEHTPRSALSGRGATERTVAEALGRRS
jgi:hypothetical protein